MFNAMVWAWLVSKGSHAFIETLSWCGSIEKVASLRSEVSGGKLSHIDSIFMSGLMLYCGSGLGFLGMD
jgi:hypothetical protein